MTQNLRSDDLLILTPYTKLKILPILPTFLFGKVTILYQTANAMSVFKGHRITVNHLLNFIPEALLVHLSNTTKVDYYTKVLHGKKVFYLLLYGILENEKLSQRSLEDTFNDPVFKLLFDLNSQESVCRSSISERLSKIDPAFFEKAYECIYEQFSDLYTPTEREKYNLVRVDSSMVSETVGKLMEGMGDYSGKKAVKYCF